MIRNILSEYGFYFFIFPICFLILYVQYKNGKKFAIRTINQFSQYLESPQYTFPSFNSLLSAAELRGVYKGREIKCWVQYVPLDNCFGIEASFKNSQPKKAPWSKNGMKLYSNDDQYKQIGEKIMYVWQSRVFLGKEIKFPRSPKEILDGLIDACNKAEQPDTNNPPT